MKKLSISPKRKRQVMGICLGLLFSAISYTVLSLPSNENLLTLGPANTGHDELACQDCHTKAPGTAIQQIEANFMHFIGNRKTEVDFGHLDVDTKKCQGCHDRPNDRHPMHRFHEPRFAETRKKLAVTECETCHKEHAGVRLTLPLEQMTYCSNCHDDLVVNNDPLDVSHEQLIAQEKWTTCLQCHDFHGNHFMETPKLMRDTISIDELKAYFDGGDSPFSDQKKYDPKKKPEEKLVANKKNR